MLVIKTTDEVFGVNRDLPLNYVTRKDVDEKFIESLSRGKHIVIYGSSKQGKTSLRKKCLEDDDYVVVSCQNKWTISELHGAVLKECGFEVKLSNEKTVAGAHKISVTADAKFGIPIVAEAKGQGGYQFDATNTDKVVSKPLELDPGDPNDIIRALQSINFKKFIVLEDFHYLPDETQRDFSFSLKTFHEQSKLSFIIVGVWREENRLISFNGDLTDRVLSVDVDTWSRETLIEVIRRGSSILNIEFDPNFIDILINKCFDSVYIVQEACRRACIAQEIHQTQSATRIVGKGIDVNEIVARVVEEQAARYRSFLYGFADGFQETDLEMPKWVIYSILCSDVENLEKGIRLRRISRIIKLKHNKGTQLNNGNITQILNSSSSLQNKKSVRPLVIDYDSANTTLNVVDKGFLIWLSSQDRAELLEELSLPEAPSADELEQV